MLTKEGLEAIEQFADKVRQKFDVTTDDALRKILNQYVWDILAIEVEKVRIEWQLEAIEEERAYYQTRR